MILPLISSDFFSDLFSSPNNANANGIEKTTGMLEIKTVYAKDETLTAKLSGNFLNSVTKENIFLYRRHVRVPLEPYIAKINNTYYIYAQLAGKQPENYSLVIENVLYYKGAEISQEPITANFSISSSTADFSISPGFIITNKNFFIEAQNLQSSSLTIQVDSIFISDKLVTLFSGEKKKINFNLNLSQPVVEIIKLSSENLFYEIPVYVYEVPKINQSNQSVLSPSLTESFELQPPEFNISMATNSSAERIIYLYNTGETKLENISLSLSSSISQYTSLSTDKIEEIENGSFEKFTINFSSDADEQIIKGEIKAETENFSASLPVTLNFIKNFVPKDEDKKEIPNVPTNCLELKGKFCSSGETCDGETVYAKDGVCCLGICKKPADQSTKWRLIGFAIIIILVVFLIWFFKTKYKGKKGVDLLKVAKGEK